MPTSVNPATGEVLQEHQFADPASVDRIRNASWDAFQEWRSYPLHERGEYLSFISRLLLERTEPLAAMMVQEMGKPKRQAEAEIRKCATVCDYYVSNAAEFLRGRAVELDSGQSVVQYDPLGPILAIMPWNFPFWQVFRFVAPSLMAGNTVLVKHAPNVFGCAKLIAQLFADADFPEGVYADLPVTEDEVALLIQHEHIRAVTLTGSDRAGSAVASAAGRALKKVVLELGGSDPFIVLADANLEAALDAAVASRTLNTGQSCIAAKRFIVHESLYESFLKGLTERFRELRVGDPALDTTDVGPLARRDLLDTLEAQVNRTVQAGAQLIFGGHRVFERGFFFQPTVLGNVEVGMPAFSEEVFGPVASVARFEDEGEAIFLANATSYGLGASIWTGNSERARALSSDIEAGVVCINRIVASDPRVPFGGVKRSGYGRELSREGIHEFVNIKTVCLGENV